MHTVTEIACAVISKAWNMLEEMAAAIWSAIAMRSPGLASLRGAGISGSVMRSLAGVGTHAEPAVIAATIFFCASQKLAQDTVSIEEFAAEIMRLGESTGLKGISIRINIEMTKLFTSDTIVAVPPMQNDKTTIATAYRSDYNEPQELTVAGVNELLQIRKRFRIVFDHHNNQEFGEVYFDDRPMHLPTPNTERGERTHLNLTGNVR
jgi:hypothetical protein